MQLSRKMRFNQHYRVVLSILHICVQAKQSDYSASDQIFSRDGDSTFALSDLFNYRSNLYYEWRATHRVRRESFLILASMIERNRLIDIEYREDLPREPDIGERLQAKIPLKGFNISVKIFSIARDSELGSCLASCL